MISLRMESMHCMQPSSLPYKHEFPPVPNFFDFFEKKSKKGQTSFNWVMDMEGAGSPRAGMAQLSSCMPASRR